MGLSFLFIKKPKFICQGFLQFLAANLLLCSGQAVAASGSTGGLGLFYFVTDSTSTDRYSDTDFLKTTAKTTFMFMTADYCYLMDVLCIGAKYLDAKVTTDINTNYNNANFSDSKIERHYSGIGVKLGLNFNSFLLHYTYIIEPELIQSRIRSNSITKTNYTVRSGTLLDLGYGFKVRNIYIGPLVSIMTFDISGYDNGSGREIEDKSIDTYTTPHIAVWTNF